MNKEAINQRSKGLINYFWLTWIFGIILETILKAPWSFIFTLFLGGVLVFGTIHLLIIKKKLVIFIPYLIVIASYGLCYLMILNNMHITTMVLFFFGITMVSFYHEWKPVMFSFLVSSSISVYLFMTKPEVFKGFTIVNYGTFIAVLLIVAGTMIGQSIMAKNSQKSLEEKNESLEKTKKQNEELLIKTNQSYQLLVDFSKELRKNIQITTQLSELISDNFIHITKKTENQKNSTHQINQSIEEGLGLFQSNMESTNELFVQTEKTYETTVKSYDEIQNFKQEIEQIQHSIFETADMANTLYEEAKQIESILEYMEDITQKTNLLALNAAIESSHLGEEGKGIRVVAGEIKNLSSLAQESTEGIGERLLFIKDAVEKIKTKMNNEKESIQKGKLLIEKMNETGEQVLGNTKVVREQTKTAQAFNQSMNEMMKHIQSESESVEKEVNESVQLIEMSLGNIENQNQNLEKIIKQFEKVETAL